MKEKSPNIFGVFVIALFTWAMLEFFLQAASVHIVLAVCAFIITFSQFYDIKNDKHGDY